MQLLSFSEFINEGVRRSPDGESVIIDRNNDPNDNNEIKTDWGLTKKLDYRYTVYWSLQTRSGASVPARNIDGEPLPGKNPHYVKRTMDILKSGENIEGNLTEFMSTLKRQLGEDQRMYNIDYLVPVGSTTGLVAKMASSLKELYPKAQMIDLPKKRYDDPSAAIDWEKIRRHGKESNRKLVLDFLDTQGMIPVEDQADSDKFTWKEDATPLPYYEIKKSGRIKASIAPFFKKKYDYEAAGFAEAVQQCVQYGKTMLIFDDNTLYGNDFREIFSNVEQIAAAHSESLMKNIDKKDMNLYFRLSSAFSTYNKRIAGYVLYKMRNEDAPQGKENKKKIKN